MGRISLTSDLWTDKNMTSFMAVTLHWIARSHEGELELLTALGGFRWVRDKHSGENIAARFVDILEELDILDKIGGITMDNAKNNNTAMDRFEDLLKGRGIKYIPLQQRIRCISHIIHLAVEAALEVLPYPHHFDPAALQKPALEAKWHEAQLDGDYTEGLKLDLVSKIQDLVKKLRSSGQRRDALQDVIIAGNRDGRFRVSIPCLQLLRRVTTRWSSCFQMIDRWLHLTPAINSLVENPNPTSLTRDKVLKVKHTEIVDDIRGFLSFFNAAQETLAAEKTPTLPFVLPMYEDLLGGLNDLCETGYPKLMHAIHASIKKLEKYRDECRRSDLYTLAMGMQSDLPEIVIDNSSSSASRGKV
jgi:hypothetical protein